MTDGVRRPFSALAVFTGATGLIALAALWWLEAPVFSWQFVFLLLAAIISENYTVVMGRYSFSIAYPLMMGTIVLCGATSATLLAGLSSLTLFEIRRLHWSVNLFNMGQMLLSSAIAGVAYTSFGGRTLIAADTVHRFVAADFPAALLPLLAAALVGSLANVALASMGVSAKNGIALNSVVESVGLLPVGQFAFGIVGFIIAEVMAINLAAFVLFVFPLLVARQFFERYSALKSAYTDTIRSLIGALEAKDPYTRGHSERVALYSVLVGRRMELDSRELGDLETAALLHDLGKLSLPGPVLRKPGALDDSEWAAMREHPERGAAMVRRIPPLRRLADTVEAHHERLDGNGYPAGNPAMPLHARILTVADSYDAMTSKRAYKNAMTHQEACEELRRCVGTHYERDIVEHLIAALGPLAAMGEPQAQASLGVAEVAR